MKHRGKYELYRANTLEAETGNYGLGRKISQHREKGGIFFLENIYF